MTFFFKINKNGGLLLILNNKSKGLINFKDLKEPLNKIATLI